MDWIQAECRTYLDDYQTPINKFAALPKVGDMVQVYYKGTDRKLEIVTITHRCRNIDNQIPYIEVELHKPKLS